MRIEKLRAAWMAALFSLVTLLALPLSANGDAGQLVNGVRDTVQKVTSGILPSRAGAPARSPHAAPAPPAAGGPSTPRDDAPSSYQPPLHGSNPHGQGTVSSTIVQPIPIIVATNNRDHIPGEETVVIGRSRGEEQANGDYHGRITIIGINAPPLPPFSVQVETVEGETKDDALLAAALNALCAGSSGLLCAQLLETKSSTDGNSSDNSFKVAGAQISTLLTINAATSEGNISEDSNCQTATGKAAVVDSNLAQVGTTETQSKSCRDGTKTQTNESQLVMLGASPVNLCPADHDGFIVDALPVIQIACNSDDRNGLSEPLVQAGVPYGVREVLTARLLFNPQDPTAPPFLQTRAAAAESHAEAPPAPPVPPTPVVAPLAPNTPDDGDDGRDEPDDEGNEPDTGVGAGPGAPLGSPDRALPVATRNAQLAFTGADLLALLLTGALALLLGLWLFRSTEPARQPR